MAAVQGDDDDGLICGAVVMTGIEVTEKTYAVLEPQALLAVTDTEPAPLPAVSVMLLVVLVPLHPVPLTCHV